MPVKPKEIIGHATLRGSMSTSTRVTGRKIPPKTLAKIGAAIQSDAVVIFPTETVYGIGTSVFSQAGIKRIYALKGRHHRKPLALLVHSLYAASPLVESIPKEAQLLAEQFWPGPLTLIFKASPLGRMVTGGLATIGVRIPDHPVALSILKTI